jgi:hypothetical protein
LRASRSDATSPADRQIQHDVADDVFLTADQAAAADPEDDVDLVMKGDGRCKPLGVNGNTSELDRRAVNQRGWLCELAAALPPAIVGRGGTQHHGWAQQPGRRVASKDPELAEARAP